MIYRKYNPLFNLVHLLLFATMIYAQDEKLVKKLYKLDNKTVSYFDPLFSYPLRFQVEQFTRGQVEEILLVFHQKEGKVEWAENSKKKNRTGIEEIKEGMQ